MNCLSALRGVCAPLSVGKVCHCAPPIAQQLRCSELSQGHCADPIAQTPSSKLAWLNRNPGFEQEVARVPFPPVCAAAWPSHTAPYACASAHLPQRLHPMACLERCCSRATSFSRFSRGMARTYLSRIYNINLFCDCAQLRTGSHRNNFPLAHPIAHPDFKCSKIFIARLHCSKKDN